MSASVAWTAAQPRRATSPSSAEIHASFGEPIASTVFMLEPLAGIVPLRPPRSSAPAEDRSRHRRAALRRRTRATHENATPELPSTPRPPGSGTVGDTSAASESPRWPAPSSFRWSEDAPTARWPAQFAQPAHPNRAVPSSSGFEFPTQSEVCASGERNHLQTDRDRKPHDRSRSHEACLTRRDRGAAVHPVEPSHSETPIAAVESSVGERWGMERGTENWEIL